MVAFVQQKQYYAEQQYDALIERSSEEASYYKQRFLEHCYAGYK